MIIDAPVLDGVFQPLTDRLGAWGYSNFNVARFFTDGATVLLLITVLILIDDLHKKDTPWGMSMATGGLLIPVIVLMMTWNRLQITSLERITKPGMLNVGRRTLMPSRLIGLFLTIDHVWDLFRDASWMHLFNLVGYGCWMVACYFASCTPRPPTTQFSAKRSWLRFAFGT